MHKNNIVKLSDFGFNILQIESYAACNMECSFCPYPLKNDKTTKLDTFVIKGLIDQIDCNDEKFQYITFSQFNEPLLDSRIFELIEYAKSKNLKILLITNGLLLNKEKNIRSIFQSKPEVKISLQVIDKNIHYDARGLNLELEKYSKTIFDFCRLADKECSDLKITIDVGCSFNESYWVFFFKKLFGLQTGDPSVPINKSKLSKNLNNFIKMLSQINQDYFFKNNLIPNLNDDYFNPNYISQDGYKFSKNIKLKIKPFFYGRRIQEFKPVPSDIFSCHNQILGILADGSVVPCCLAYEKSISLGSVLKYSLFDILSDNNFLKNLRNINGTKHITCRKCFGEPSKRGVIFRTVKFKLGKLIKSF